MLFVIGRALAQGRRAALTTVIGSTLGAYVLIVAVALGIGSIVERSVLVFTALKLWQVRHISCTSVSRRCGTVIGEAGDGATGDSGENRDG